MEQNNIQNNIEMYVLLKRKMSCKKEKKVLLKGKLDWSRYIQIVIVKEKSIPAAAFIFIISIFSFTHPFLAI